MVLILKSTYRQLYAEGTVGGELSRLARENHNYAGLTQVEPKW